MTRKMEIRKHVCLECGQYFFVDCDNVDYPALCPYCGVEISGSQTAQDSYTIDYNDENE